MRTVLPFLFLLACPLMMVVCMRGKRGQTNDPDATTTEAAGLRAEIAELREEVARQRRDRSAESAEQPSRFSPK